MQICSRNLHCSVHHVASPSDQLILFNKNVKIDFARALWETPEAKKRSTFGNALRRLGERDDVAGAATIPSGIFDRTPQFPIMGNFLHQPGFCVAPR